MIIVTGSSGGIGSAIVQAFHGEYLIGIDQHNCDLTDVCAISEFVKTITGPVCVLVNCAGLSVGGWDEIFAVNVTAPYVISTLLRDRLYGGSIINITSINSHLGFPGNPAYVASKAALWGLTKALAVDFAPFDIRVNAVSPGYIRAPMTEKSYSNPEERKKREDRTILGRYGEPTDVASAVLFLVEAKYITGAEIVVDGGWMAKGL